MNAWAQQYLQVMGTILARGTAAWERQERRARRITDELRLRSALKGLACDVVDEAVTRAKAAPAPTT
jgi:hypothetical protein